MVLTYGNVYRKNWEGSRLIVPGFPEKRIALGILEVSVTSLMAVSILSVGHEG
jgi:hypothetical protein